MKKSTKVILIAGGLTLTAVFAAARAGYPPQAIASGLYNMVYDSIYREDATNTLMAKSASCNHKGDAKRLRTVLEKSKTRAMEELNKRGIRVCFYKRLDDRARAHNSNIVQGVYYPDAHLAIWDSYRFSPEAVINSLPADLAKNFDYKEKLTIPMQAMRRTSSRGSSFTIDWQHVDSPSESLFDSPFTPR